MLLDYNYVQSSFSTITRYIKNSILKETLQLKILRIWIKLRANSFIKIWINIMKKKSTHMSLKLSLENNMTPHLKEHRTKIDDILLIVIHFFFSQRNLVFKSGPVLIDILDSFSHNLFTFLPFDYLYSVGFEIHSLPLHLFCKSQ